MRAEAKLFMHAVEGGDDIVTPLNVLVGGQASQERLRTLRLRGAG